MKILRSLTCCFCFFILWIQVQSQSQPVVGYLSPVRVKVYPLLLGWPEAKVSAEFSLNHRRSLEVALDSRFGMAEVPGLLSLLIGGGIGHIFERRHIGIEASSRFYFGRHNKPGQAPFFQVGGGAEVSTLKRKSFAIDGNYYQSCCENYVRMSPLILSQSIRTLVGLAFGKSRPLSFDFYTGLGVKSWLVFPRPLDEASAERVGTRPRLTIRPTFHLGLAVAFNVKQPGAW